MDRSHPGGGARPGLSDDHIAGGAAAVGASRRTDGDDRGSRAGAGARLQKRPVVLAGVGGHAAARAQFEVMPLVVEGGNVTQVDPSDGQHPSTVLRLQRRVHQRAHRREQNGGVQGFRR